MAWIKPMKPVIGGLPKGPGWGHELKWDGMRLCVCVSNGALSLYSASGRDLTRHFPELARFAKHLGTDATFDAEAVVFDGDRPSFSSLQHRIHVSKPSTEQIEANPVFLVVFDLLSLGPNPMVDLQYRQRRKILGDLLVDGPAWRVPPYSEGDGQALYDLAKARGLEGIVSKRLDSRYRPGARNPEWVKVKIFQTQEFVVGGWLGGTGSLEGEIGSVLVGTYARRNQPSARLLFAGSCGSGLNESFRRQLGERFVPANSSPFDNLGRLAKLPRFVEPNTVVEIAYGQWLEGQLLRHPVFRGIRTDRDPKDVISEVPVKGRSVE